MKTNNCEASPGFDAFEFKRQFPSLADENLRYLDNAATAQMPAAVLETLRQFELESRANVHGGAHRLARAAIAAYDEARRRAARFLNANSADEIIFTYGATSSINLLAHSFGSLMEPGDEILLSVLEHHSNLVPWQTLAAQRGVILRFLPMTADGRIDLDRLDDELTDRCRLIALTHCSNVTGAWTDVDRVVAAARRAGTAGMLDGAQGAPHGPVDVRQLGIDFYAFSGHKTYGPTGIGVLWGRRELLATLPPFMTGGQMIAEVTLSGASFQPPPRRFEAGTPPIAAAVGLGAALNMLQQLDWHAVHSHEVRLTQHLIEGLQAIPGLRILGPTDTDNRRGVVSFVIDGIQADEICRDLDRRGLALRGGHHCAQPLMRAFGVVGAARASLAPYNTNADVEALLAAVEELAH